MRIKYILICFSILFCACNTSIQDFEQKTWLSAADGIGMRFLGVLDMEKNPYSAYLLSYQEEKATLFIRDDSIYFDSTYYGNVFYQNDTLLVLAASDGDTSIYHSIPNLDNADSIEFVYDFLVSNPVLYSDETAINKMQYDSTVNELGWNKSFVIDSLRQYDFETFSNWVHDFDYNFHTKWHLTSLNNSVILLNSPTNWLEGFSFDILLIEKITPEKLTAKKIEIPFIGRRAKQDSIRANSTINFKYETCTFEKRQSIQSSQLKSYFDILCSKTWSSNIPDSAIYTGKGVIPIHDTITIHPPILRGFSYEFNSDQTYEYSIGGVTSKGEFEISRDGEYLILDKSSDSASCIKLNNISNNFLKIQQLANAHTKGRGFERYNCYLTLE